MMRPTRFIPGSPQKVEVLRKRASAFVRLWHPRDAESPRVPENSPPLPSHLVVPGRSEEALSANLQRFLKAVLEHAKN